MRTCAKISLLFFTVSVAITLMDLAAVPMCPCIDPWTIYAFVAWFVTFGCSVYAVRASLKGSYERKILSTLIVLALFCILFTSIGIYTGYRDEIAFQEEIYEQQRLQNN